MTLTFNLATWFLFATHCLIMLIICANVFSNPTMHNKAMGRTWTGFSGLGTKFKRRLWPWPLTQRHGSYLRRIALSWWSFVSNYFQIPLSITKLWVGHEQVSLKSMHKVYVQTVTLTFNLATWFLFATHRLVMMIICATLFSNPIMYG